MKKSVFSLFMQNSRKNLSCPSVISPLKVQKYILLKSSIPPLNFSVFSSVNWHWQYQFWKSIVRINQLIYKGVLTVLWMYSVAVFIICYDFTLRVYFPVINLTKSSLKLYYETLLNFSGVNQGILRFITCYIRRTLFENQPFKLQKVHFTHCVLLSG